MAASHTVAPVARSALAMLDTGDARMASTIAKLTRVIERGIPILIVGETGTGKEVLARALHADSPRAAHALVHVHCDTVGAAAFDATLSALDPSAARLPGGAAPAGMVLLDDIDALPLELQGVLLRRLSPSAGRRADDAAPPPILVCTTRADLRARCDEQRFREDLYYRINGLSVLLPPLRERSDVLALARTMLATLATPRAPALADDVAAMIESHRWPGNARQLHNMLRTACALAGPGATAITREHLSDDMLGPVCPDAGTPATDTHTLEDLELAAVQRAVQAAGGNISEAAKRLGTSRNTIYRKLRRATPR